MNETTDRINKNFDGVNAEILLVDWNRLQEIGEWQHKPTFIVVLSKKVDGFVDISSGYNLVRMLHIIADGWKVSIGNIGIEIVEWEELNASIMLVWNTMIVTDGETK